MRLIDADTLKLYFIANLCGHGTCLNPTGQAEVRFMIDEAPTIEAEPVRHGRWIMLPYIEQYNYKCSNCEKGSDLMTDYCPHCGAKMDLDE